MPLSAGGVRLGERPLRYEGQSRPLDTTCTFFFLKRALCLKDVFESYHLYCFHLKYTAMGS